MINSDIHMKTWHLVYVSHHFLIVTNLYMKTFGDEKWSNPWFRLGMLNEATPNSVPSSIQHNPQEQKCRWQRTQTPPLLRSHWWRSYEGFNCCTVATNKSWMLLQWILDVVPSKNGPKTPSKNKNKKMMMMIWTGKFLKNSSHRL